MGAGCAGLASVIERAEQVAQPLAVSYAVTRRCDRHCTICYLPPGETVELDTAEAVEAVQRIAAAGALFLAVTGGEPCLRADLLDILRAARGAGLAVELLTHGGHVDAGLAQALAGLNLLAAHVTVFATAPGIHDRLCGQPGGLTATLQGIDHLLAAGVPTVLCMPLLKANFAERQAVHALAARLGAGFVSDPTISPRDDGDLAPLALQLDDTQLAEFLAEQPAPVPQDDQAALCAAGHRTLHVDPDGTVRPCIQDPRAIGSLRSDDLRALWESHPTLLELRSRRRRDLRAVCRDCTAVGICGRCPALALMVNGDDLGPWEWACRRAALLEA